MKFLRKLTTFYYIGFGFLVAIILIAFLSFQGIYKSIEEVSEITGKLFAEGVYLYEPQRLSTALSKIEEIRIRAYIFFIIALLVTSGGALLFVYIYRKSIVEPLHQIISATKKISEGKFEELSVINGTEMGMLMENFNFMSHALENKVKELESAVIREQRVVRRLNILNELTGSLIHKLELQDVLQTMISNSMALIKSEFSAIALSDPLTRKITYFRTSLTDEAGQLRALTDNLMEEIIVRKTSISERVDSDRLSKATELKYPTGGSLEIKNLLAIPLMIEGEIRGAIILGNRIGAQGFTQEDEDTALMFTFQCAMGIERAILHEKIVHLAKTDGLTGLNNHRTFHEVLGVELKRAKRYHRDISLLMIDIDDFKRFNDTYGHQAGDMALKGLADILINNLRATDSAARYGGEEFTVILPETSLDAAVKIGERIRNDIASHPLRFMDKKVYLTVSAGVSVFPEDSIEKDNLIMAADDALYMAKRTGKNKVITYQEYKIASKK